MFKMKFCYCRFFHLICWMKDYWLKKLSLNQFHLIFLSRVYKNLKLNYESFSIDFYWSVFLRELENRWVIGKRYWSNHFKKNLDHLEITMKYTCLFNHILKDIARLQSKLALVLLILLSYESHDMLTLRLNIPKSLDIQ